MSKVFKLVLQGLGTALPLGVTIYALVWLIGTLEHLAKQVLIFIFPDSLYFPGVGLVAALGTLFVVGLLMNLYGMRHLVIFGNSLVQRIPLAKSIYATIKDIITVFQLNKNSQQRTVVSVDMGNGVTQIGFITGEAAGKRLYPDQDKVGVYLPMSYMIGGNTLYFDRNRLQPLDIGVEEAMRLALTGGAQSDHPHRVR